MIFKTSDNPFVKYFIAFVVLVLLVRFGYRYYKNIYQDRKKEAKDKSKESRIEAQRRDKAMLPWLIKSKKGTWETEERKISYDITRQEKEEIAKEKAARLEEVIKESEAKKQGKNV